MLEVLMLVLIYAGVSLSVYQLYDIYCSQSLEDEVDPLDAEQGLRTLSLEAQQYAATGSSSGFIQAVKNSFGDDFDHRVVLAALSGEKGSASAQALLRRKDSIVSNGKIRIQHFRLCKTNPPTRDMRGALLLVVSISALLVMFLGGLSVYTVAYEISIDSLSWANSAFVIMLLVYALIAITHLMAKFDRYMHDLYQIGKLNNRMPVSQADSA